jgi:CheY-like chemotaxis protein
LTTGLAALAVGMAQRAREREQAARPAEEAKARFLANMSHEIRTPLNGVLGMTDLLLTTDINDEQKEYLNTIRHSSTSLLAILSDILDFSKLEAGKVSLENMAFDPAMEVRDALRLLQNGFAEKGLELRLDLQDLPRKVEGDALRLRQIVLHLAGNALKFTERGSVQIEGRLAGENKLRFRVIDSGCGVPKEARPKLFDSFTQADASTKRRYGGTGLGLAISRRLAHLMGGDLGLEEMADGSPGSVFWFEIAVRIIPEPKAAAVPTADVLSPVKKDTASPSGARILVAEDNEVNQRIVESFLTRMGFQVDTAANGREAVAAVTARSYGLILMDVQMPDLDGLEATAAIRRLELEAVATAASPGGENRIPIIALTANAMSGDRDRCLAAGMDDYLSKPVSADEMEAKVRQWLDVGRVNGIQALQTAVGMPSSADRSLHR